jgi:cytochrome c-type biogenesis protein CcmE
MEIKKIPRRRQRLYFGLFSIAIISFAAYITLDALDENLQFFKTPSELVAKANYNKTFRLGGYVKDGSLKQDGVNYEFIVTDFEHEIEVIYSGFMPALFREGQGVVAIGKLQHDGLFAADKILAKHDEKYMPPEIAGKIKHEKPSLN